MPSDLQFDFSGRTAFVTGASRGIGLAIARGFSRSGADVWILAEDSGVEDVAATIAGETGGFVRAVRCDIADAAAVEATLGQVPQIDILINNAGYQPRTPFPATDKSDAEFRRVIDVNVMGTYHVTRHAMPKMRANGRIIVTSSIWGKTGAAEYAGYCASKHANIGFMRALALDLAPRGITVNAVCPGWVDTEGALWTVREIASDQDRPVGALIDDYLKSQPLKGMMAIDDLVATYLFLASGAAKDITGQAINVDRGIFIG